MRVLFPLLLACGLAAAADVKEVEGAYTLKSASTGGKAATAEFLAAVKEVKVSASEVVITGTDGKEQKLPVKFDGKSTPAAVDFLPPTKDEKGREGIYKLENGELTIVLSAAGGKRPTDFKGDGDGVRVMVLTKKK